MIELLTAIIVMGIIVLLPIIFYGIAFGMAIIKMIFKK